MVTYPSTHGVFEYYVKKLTDVIHKNGGQVIIKYKNSLGLYGRSQFQCSIFHNISL